jgi:UDP-N-acetylmuramoyl-tripeptide--D-alanyl-D-alanine ligase
MISTSQARWSIVQLVEATQACVIGDLPLSQSFRLWTDTRDLTSNDVFLPLVGTNFNGHHYLLQAVAKGCVVAFAEAEFVSNNPDLYNQLPCLLVVPSTINAYLQIARFYRQQLDPIVLALTGSSGKTTTKDMLASALSPLMTTQKTDQNFNNEVGVCQTLLALAPQTRLSIVEMGMRGLGQIDLLTRHAQPDFALITNVGPAHIELLGSMQAIATAKCELLNGLEPETGIAVLNKDDTLLCDTAKKVWTGKTIYYSLEQATPLPCNLGEAFLVDGQRIDITVTGQHMVSNALAVLAVGQQLGFSLAQLATGLAQFVPTQGRGNRIILEGFAHTVGLTNDAYNANPASMKAALAAFLVTKQTPSSTKILVLAGMNELGPFSKQYHQELGFWLKANYSNPGMLNALFVLGPDAEWIADAAEGANFLVTASNTLPMLASSLKAWLNTLSTPAEILLKGSRTYQLEELATLLGQTTVSKKSASL